MEKSRKKRVRAVGVLLVLMAALLYSRPVRQLASLPRELRVTQGRGALVRLSALTRAEADEGSSPVIAGLSQRLGEVSIEAGEQGSAALTLKLLGIIPIGRLSVQVEEEKTLYPGGEAIGVALRTQGVLVVGTGDLGLAVPSPARSAGLRAGDLITRVDGAPVSGAEELSALANREGERQLTVLRGGQELTFSVTPVRDPRDSSFRLGLWVRDSTAGVGTLSYYDPETGQFGALGHAVTDLDTGVLLPVGQGEILPGRIEAVHRGERGNPGELVSRLPLSEEPLGSIRLNTALGIYGQAYQPLVNPLYPDGIPLMRRDEARTGPVTILSTVDGEGVAAYQAELIRIDGEFSNPQRALVLRITDPALLQKTGGIVQGMSGSPILQDGRLLGAVTHVLINDPATGYGIFLQDMLEAGAEALPDAA